MSGSAIRKTLVNNTMVGRHRWIIRWAMFYREDGTTCGRFSFLGRRRGKWWLEGDIFCAAWPMMNNGRTNRYVAFRNADRVKWFRLSGEEMRNDRVLPGNPMRL
ncbi:MAG: hypothetical protein AAFY44_12660 [Pseudomonadota bacterium]